MYSTPRERETLLKWMGTARWTYNRCLDLIKEREHIPRKQLRKLVINNDNYEFENTWVKDTPPGIRDRAFSELMTAYKTNFAKRKKNKNFKFEIKKRSKKYKSQTITVEKRDFIRDGGEYAFLKHIKTSESLPEINNAVNITRDRLGRFYFCVCVP
ncbi:5551_t:CDS:1 [Dentiscutata erythropus]|uniref:5551_t:CDS:1 n=1 Tax=Dentiscutata erythropus TaxID=1348616 RepID=A0A9N9IIC7_9GLOM|nr:5551_t:CDS:1 [Dentiscutata erythropus]